MDVALLTGAGGEEEEEAPMTTSIVFEEAKTAQPTQTIGKDFIPKVGAVPDRGGSRKDFPRKPITTEVRHQNIKSKETKSRGVS